MTPDDLKKLGEKARSEIADFFHKHPEHQDKLQATMLFMMADLHAAPTRRPSRDDPPPPPDTGG